MLVKGLEEQYLALKNDFIQGTGEGTKENQTVQLEKALIVEKNGFALENWLILGTGESGIIIKM